MVHHFEQPLLLDAIDQLFKVPDAALKECYSLATALQESNSVFANVRREATEPTSTHPPNANIRTKTI
jgi:hypothetical protein